MLVPFVGKMPYGGARIYGGLPKLGEWDGTRYIHVHKGKSYKVARLVCEAFHGMPSPQTPYCLHIDENSRNNKPSNLKWGTQKENLNAPGFLDYCRRRVGADSPLIKGRIRRQPEKQP
jgi:hypothetical protein